MKNDKNNENNEVILTPELFKEIIASMSDDLIELKEQKNMYISRINSESENLAQLKTQYKEIKNNIKLSRRALSREKRSLKRIISSLNLKTGLFTEINTKFTSNEESYIDVKRYVKTKNEG